jgi:hypothetical protein
MMQIFGICYLILKNAPVAQHLPVYLGDSDCFMLETNAAYYATIMHSRIAS